MGRSPETVNQAGKITDWIVLEIIKNSDRQWKPIQGEYIRGCRKHMKRKTKQEWKKSDNTKLTTTSIKTNE